MGKDKALLPFAGGALAAHVAAAALDAAGSAVLVGDPQKYNHLGYLVIPDRRPGAGPLGGIETALSHTAADWNLVLACDMPSISAAFLRNLLDAAEQRNADALVPAGPSGQLEPLTAVYHRRSLAAFQRALESGVRRITDALAGLAVARWAVDDGGWFQNLNTPEEWACYCDSH